MSELLNRVVVAHLRKNMFPNLPQNLQSQFPTYKDPFLGDGPNIRTGALAEIGARGGFPMITVTSRGALEGLTRGTYRHLLVSVDFWTSPAQAGNVDGRPIISILYQYTNQFLQDVNFSGQGISIQRCFEVELTDIMFDSTDKLYHIANTYRVEAVSKVWY